MALLARRGRFEPAAVSEELARAAAEGAAGLSDRARRRYARLAKSLAAGPSRVRGLRGAALVGQAGLAAAAGDGAEALSLYGQAFGLVADPARELPREALRALALERLRAATGSLAVPLAFLRASSAGAVSAADAQALTQVTGWVQRVCGEGSAAAREDACGQAVAGLPGRDWPVLALAAVLVEAGRAGAAERVLADAAPSGGGEVWFRWAAVLFTAGRWEQAVAGFDEALRRGTSGEVSPWARGAAWGAECLLFRGLARERLGLDEAARADLVAAVTHAPADPRPRDAVARMALRLGAVEVAREQFEAALEASAGYGPARLGLALIEERAGRFADAAGLYQAAVSAAPGWRAARVRWGAALTAAGEHARAVEVLWTLADAAGDGPGVAAAFHLGAALFASGDAAGALEWWEAIPGEEVAAHRAAARDQVARGLLAADPGAAREEWQHAVAQHPLPAYRAGMREAALREAAFALLTGRDEPAGCERAARALEHVRTAASPPAASDPLDTTLGAAAAGREARLMSALALAREDAAGVSGPVRPGAGVRERCDVAAALLVSGRAKQAAVLLAELTPDPAGDAMLARVRGLLAERAGDWRGAAGWHMRFLSVAGPGGVPRGMSETAQILLTAEALAEDRACTAAGAPCAVPATRACGACGREGCAGHVHRVDGSLSERCVGCAVTGLAAVLACAREADALGEVEPALAAWAVALGGIPAGAGARRTLALVRAQLGDLDAALELLADDSGDGGGRGAAERAVVLVRRAVLDLREGRAVSAAGDLRAAVELMPGHPGLCAALGRLAEHEAWGHATEGRWREAFEGYLPLLCADPAHPRLLQAVGVTGYRLAAAGKARPGTLAGASDAGLGAGDSARDAASDAGRVWAWTVGALVAALYLPESWAHTAQAAGRVLEPGQVAAARSALMERLRTDLLGLDLSAGRTGEEVGAWALRLDMEVRCAEAFAQQDLHVTLTGGPARRLVLGPGLHRLLTTRGEAGPGALPAPASAEWREQYARAVGPFALASQQAHEAHSPVASSALTEVFGLLHPALGAHRYLVLQGRSGDAITALEALPAAQHDAAYRALLAQAQTGLGEELYRGREWRQALAAFARAAQLSAAGLSERHAQLAADCGRYASRALLGEQKAPARRTGNEDQDFVTALELLHKARQLAPQDRELAALQRSIELMR